MTLSLKTLGSSATLQDVLSAWRDIVRAIRQVDEKADRIGGLVSERATAATHTLSRLSDIVLVDYTATGACTVTLPPVADKKEKIVIIKDSGGNAAANNITIDGDGSELIDGSATIAITANYGSETLYSDGTDWHKVG